MRPEFITNEDIARWSESMENDPNMPQAYLDQPLIREVCYAGMWLCEELEKAGCNELLITRIQFTAGQLSFGHNPWTVHQEMLEAYKNNQLEFEVDYDAPDA